MTRLVIFGFDAAEAAQIRRIHSYMDCGFDVQGFTMRRDNMNVDFTPFWPNVELGQVPNEDVLRRVGTLAAAVPVIRRNRDKLAGADVIVARNLDMLALAVVAQGLTPGSRPPLIYECLDIHGAMTDTGAKGRVFRGLERRLLLRTRLLIVSSPAFLSAYFGPVQGWDGPSVLLENKLWIEGDSLARPTPDAPPAPVAGDAIRLGWVGTLRCPRSLALLAAAAETLGPRLSLRFHGAVHSHALPDFDAVVAAHPNISYGGPYAYPDDLAGIYANCDLVWSQDLWQWGTNSTWLLPNRIYEASYFGCPSLAVEGTETGRRVANGLGWALPVPTSEALVACIKALTPATIAQARRKLLTRPETDFRLGCDEIRGAIALALDP
ncbi:MAG: glycosyl transferase [Pseudomonadota bacterium]